MRGSLVQKPKGIGRWYVVLELDRDAGGRRRQKWHSGYRTKREAERALAGLVAARYDQTYVEPRRISVEEYLANRWLPVVKSTLRSTTFAGYERHVRVHVVPRLGRLSLQTVTPDRLSTMYRELLEHGGENGRDLTPATVRRVHATLHCAFRDAVAWGYLLRNPADAAVKPRQRGPGSKEIVTWSATELSAFLDQVRGDRLYAAWHLAASTGMRRGELLGLRWVDVDLDAARISVRQTVTTIGQRVVYSEPKTAKGRRNVALDRATVAALRGWRASQAAERLAAGDGWLDCRLVFTREDGSLVHPDTFSFWFERHQRRAGLRRIRLHDLRHTHASLALQAGVPAKVVSERLGHATVAFTLDVYSHVVPALHEEAAERIAALITST